jgi:hypothetical protein
VVKVTTAELKGAGTDPAEADNYYARTPSSTMRKHLEDDDHELDEPYWVSQALHYGIDASYNVRAIKHELRDKLRANDGRLKPPQELLDLSYLLQDQAADEPIIKPEPEIKEEADSDSDYLEDDDDSSELDDNQELAHTRSRALPRHANRPVQSVEEQLYPSERSASRSDGSEDEEFDSNTAATSVSLSQTRSSSRKPAQSRKSRLSNNSEVETRLQLSPTSSKPKSKNPGLSLFIDIPDHLSDAPNYYTASSSPSAASPRRSTSRASVRQPSLLTIRPAKPNPAGRSGIMGAAHSKGKPPDRSPGGQEESSGYSRRKSCTR